MAGDPNATLHELNDPMTANAGEAGTWGQPGDVGGNQQIGEEHADAALPVIVLPQYAEGMFAIETDTQAVAVAASAHAKLLKRTTDAPLTTLPHEATHRRYDSPFTVPIAQAAAGFTLVAPAKPGLHFLKVLAVVADITGALPVAQNSGFVLNPADPATPWFVTSPNLALGIFSVTSKVAGALTLCYSPYDA